MPVNQENEDDYKNEVTHIIIIFLRNQDVHFRTLGTDNLTVERLLTQVDVASLCLIDGHGRHFPQDLGEG